MDSITYKNAGVDTEKSANLLKGFAKFLGQRPRDPNLMGGLGGFAACYDMSSWLTQMTAPVLVTCCDGVGTKVKLALEWNELSGVGQDLVAMNVNDMLCVGATPLLFLDYYACGKLDEEQLLQVLKSIQAGCELSQCTLAGGETAEMPGMYSVPDFDLAGFAVGVVDRTQALQPEKIQKGAKLLALPSSGVHSNGFSLVRKLVEKHQLSPSEKTPWGETWKQALLAPTTIYVPYLKDIFAHLQGVAHITGGGLLENLPRIFPEGLGAAIDTQAWKWTPLFEWLKEASGLSNEQMHTTFNCGVGMIAAIAPEEVEKVQTHLKKLSLDSWVIGEVVPASDQKVVWK